MIEHLDMHLVIRRAVTKRPDQLLDDAKLLWARFTLELVPIIGEGGFESLYMRSLGLPWLLTTESSDCIAEQPYIPFSGLTGALKKRDANEASEAIIALLSIFTDTLSNLIGVSLAARILACAWGDDAIDLSGTEQ
jgi:hypothetical protein